MGPRGREPDVPQPAPGPVDGSGASVAVGSVLVVGPPGAHVATLGRRLCDLGLPALAPGPDAASDLDVVSVPERLLHALRANPLAPPALDELDADAGRAHDLVAAIAPTPDGVWVEPANALLLPLLRRNLAGPPAVVVLAWRSPEAAVAALATEGVGAAHALALWEAYLVHALRGAAGWPLIGLDLDETPSGGADLAELLTAAGVPVSGGTGDAAGAEVAPEPHEAPESREPSEPPDVAIDTPAPDVAALARATRARLAPVLEAAAGAHLVWDPPEGLRVGAVADAVLSAQRAAHRSALDAVEAWAAAHEAATVVRQAFDAAEQGRRELVGPDPMHYRELRRELWRLRDEFAGHIAARNSYDVALRRAEAARLAAEQRVADLLVRVRRLDEMDALEVEVAALREARAQRDAMLASLRWRIGGLFTRPFAWVRRRTRAR